MTVTRNSNWLVSRGTTLSDFFDDERFYNSRRALNIKENEKAYEVELAAPGFSKKDFTISIDNGLLTVTAERRNEKDKSYTRREFGYTSFSRSFNLPANTGEDDIQAKYEEGILKLSIPRKRLSETKAKKPIEIK